MDNRWNLQGKKAVITGGTKGIGMAILQEFLHLGAEVMVVSRTKDDVEFLSKKHENVDGISADISEIEARNEVCDYIQERWDSLDILVNNVGMNIRKPTIDYTEKEYNEIMDTNLHSAFDMCRLCYPLLKNSSQGNIVNIASTAGLTHVRSGSIYGMTKAAIIQLTKNLAVEWAEDNIRVNAVAPWYILTPLVESVLKDKSYLSNVLERTPLNKIGETEDVAGAVAFLCMPAAAYITGQCLPVDGGFTINGF
ncbi:MAG TPA: tropinone reductase [Candidatus Cloacimonas sp.]|jgi:Tropinone reductase 1|nr:tropinone reductase [Candidatus Cloacimonadota bacterium]HCX72961.1 tropinone reductase [Candidatus Cloacimonas sp.]